LKPIVRPTHAYSQDLERVAKKYRLNMRAVSSLLGPGEVDIMQELSTTEGQKAVPWLYDEVESRPWRPRVREYNGYEPADFFCANGNVEQHTDSMLGTCAIMLIRVVPFKKSLNNDYGILWTESGFQSVRTGDVVIFDARQPHAWFCNGFSFFFSQLVRKSRQKASNTADALA
jgi:hypothetical protein